MVAFVSVISVYGLNLLVNMPAFNSVQTQETNHRSPDPTPHARTPPPDSTRAIPAAASQAHSWTASSTRKS